MPNFEKIIQEAFGIFQKVLPDYQTKKDFLINLDSKPSSYESLDENSRQQMNHAVNLLIENAKVTETRKLQQQHFGPALAILRQGSNAILTEIKKSDEFFTQLIQLSVIFLHFKEIENEKHNHDHIREALRKALISITPLL